jgi:Zn-finger nucleic acid-binding protein
MSSCPRCQNSELASGFGVLGEDVCAFCAGRFLPPDAVERLIVDELGVSRDVLRELIPMFASKERIACPACATKMSAVVIHDVRIDFCMGCGGCWLDRGELAKLCDGRYDEVTPAAAGAPAPLVDVPAPPARDPSSLDLSRGPQCAVFLHTLDALDAKQLAAAFASCPGLAEQDAIALARNNNGVVVDGVSAETARKIAEALTSQGVGASSADDSWTSLVSPTPTHTFEPGARGVDFGDGDVVPWPQLACVAAGLVRRSALRPNREITNALDPELVVVEGEDAMIDLFSLDPVRRHRVQLSTLIYGADYRGRDRTGLFRERVAVVANHLASHAAVGRGVRACVEDRPLPRYRSLRDLEREESWLLWRHRGPGTFVRSGS